MKAIATIFFLLVCITNTFTQDLFYSFLDKEEFEVTEKRIREVTTLDDMHHRYTSEWIDEYISTEIIYTFKGEVKKAKGANEELTKEQKSLLENAEVGSTIEVVVDYLPKNNLKNNSPKKMDLEVKIIPETIPSFKGGEESFSKYIESNFISKLDTSELNKLQFSVVQLVITNEGKSDDVYLEEGTGNMELDAKLSEVLCSMPEWNPATKTNGETVDYALKFYITNVSQSCRVNEVMIRKESLSK